MSSFTKKAGLLILLGASAIAGAQTAPGANGTPATGMQAQATQTNPSTEQPTDHPTVGEPHKPFPVEVRYYFFITETAQDHERIQQEIRNDPKRFTPDMEARNMSSTIGIQPGEWQTVLTYVLDANERLRENDRESNVALSSFRQSPGYSSKSVPPPGLKALEREHGAIINGTVDTIRKELGDESFSNLSTYVDFYFGGRTYNLVPAADK